MMTLRPLHAAVLLVVHGVAALHPPYTPAVSQSIQKWDVSTLRQQIHEQHVARVAIHSDETAVEVLDTNGLQRRVQIFPEVTSVLVDDLREAHVPFFVATSNKIEFPPILIAYAHAVVLTLLVIWMIEAMGMMEEFVFGMILVGNGLMALAAELDEAMTAAFDDVQNALSVQRNGQTQTQVELLPVRVETDDEGAFDS